MNQPEALRLAEALERGRGDDVIYAKPAAVELRRLHAEVEEQCRLNAMGSEREAALMAQVDRLTAEVEALRQEHTEDQGVISVWRGRTERAEAEAEALRSDAERYRWLRERIVGAVPMVRVQIMRRGQYVLIERELDDAVDAARSKT